MASTMSQVAGFSLLEGEPRTPKGLKIARHFTRLGVDPYAEIDWEQRTASITNEKGKIVFENVEIKLGRKWLPTWWSRNIFVGHWQVRARTQYAK